MYMRGTGNNNNPLGDIERSEITPVKLFYDLITFPKDYSVMWTHVSLLFVVT